MLYIFYFIAVIINMFAAEKLIDFNVKRKLKRNLSVIIIIAINIVILILAEGILKLSYIKEVIDFSATMVYIHFF